MGRNRKQYTDTFKIEVIKEALKGGADRSAVAVKHNIAQSTLSEWIQLFLDGKIENEEQKARNQQIALLKKQNEMMLRELGKKQLEIDLLKKNEDFWEKLGN